MKLYANEKKIKKDRSHYKKMFSFKANRLKKPQTLVA